MSEKDTQMPDQAEDAVESSQDDGAFAAASSLRHRILKWGMIALALLVIALLTLPIVSVLQPDYYRRYPALGQRMDNWAVSTHSRISCAECHMEPGIKGFVVFGAKSFPAFYSQLFQGADDTNLLEAPSIDACQQCHTAYRKVAPGGDLLIPHRAHVEVLGLDCVVCHEDLVHSLNSRGFNRPEMESCLEQCHDGDQATDECVKCHTQKDAPDTHTSEEWLGLHGEMAETGDCGFCHDWTPDYCNECHEERPASHVGNWKTEHAPHALIRGDGCIVCHGGQEFCDECH